MADLKAHSSGSRRPNVYSWSGNFRSYFADGILRNPVPTLRRLWMP